MNFKNNYAGVMDSRYSIPQYAIGGSTSAQSVNQLDEVNQRLNAGVFGVDLAPIDAKTLESIPKQHLKEIERLIKLNGARASLHGPIADLVGLDSSGRRISEEQRKFTERQMGFFIDRAHEINNEGNTPINFHINTQIPGDRWRKLEHGEYERMNEIEKSSGLKKDGNNWFVLESRGFVNQDTGEIGIVERKVKHHPWGETVFDPETQIRIQNERGWDDDRLKIFRMQKERDEVEDRRLRLVNENEELIALHNKSMLRDNIEKQAYNEFKQKETMLIKHAGEINEDMKLSTGALFHKLDYVPDHPDPNKKDFYRKNVEELRNKIKNIFTESRRMEMTYQIARANAKDPQEIRQLNEQIKKEQENQFNILNGGLNNIGVPDEKETKRLGQLAYIYSAKPETIKRSTDYSMEKTAETVSNAAYDSYRKYKKNAPIITLENYKHDLSIGTAKELKDTVENSQKIFASRLMKEGMEKEEAEKTAEKTIGVTWDVGHINFLRSTGLRDEELKKKILEEVKIVAPHVKQLHLNDNFGWDDVHLAPGMGNAPIKSQIEMLKKQGFKFEKGSLISEPGGFAAQFKQNPHVDTLSYFESPMFQDGVGPGEPNWYLGAETDGFYRMGYGPFLPQTHFKSLYGAGFSNLPPELGGIGTGEGQSRFAG